MPTPNNFKGQVFGLKEMYNGSYYARSVSVSWISGKWTMTVAIPYS